VRHFIRHSAFVIRHSLPLLFVCCLLAGGCYNPPKTGNPFIDTPRSRNKTERSLDLAIIGDGYFIVQIQTTSGFLFTRRGAMSVSTNGELVNEDGYRLYPPIIVGDANLITITPDGVVRARHGDNGPADVAGQILLARFDKTENLVIDGHYRMPSDNSGNPTTARPGANRMGVLAIGELEK